MILVIVDPTLEQVIQIQYTLYISSYYTLKPIGHVSKPCNTYVVNTHTARFYI